MGVLESIESGVIPSKSIFISPFVSIGIGCESVEGGTGIGSRSASRSTREEKKLYESTY
jgi:hypothetical protein